jgi:hypothetical protein
VAVIVVVVAGSVNGLEGLELADLIVHGESALPLIVIVIALAVEVNPAALVSSNINVEPAFIIRIPS